MTSGMHVVALAGLQASGKTTFCRERFAATHAHVSLDLLRTRARERRAIADLLARQVAFVVDNTNVTRAERAVYVRLAPAALVPIVLCFLSSRVQECLARNDLREGAGRIPRAGVLGTAARIEIPSSDEGFERMWFVRQVPGAGFSVEEWADEVR